MTGPYDPAGRYDPQPGAQSPQYPQYPSQPAYPGGPYAGYPPPGGYAPGPYGPPAPAPARGQVWERLGARTVERPAPRLGVAFAGVGVALAVVGVVVWGLSYVTGDQLNFTSGNGGGSSSRHFLGAGLAFLVTVLGYLLAIRVRVGPLATAGVAASALAVPVTLEFLTLDAASGHFGNFDVVVWISVAVYLISYFAIPGTRGHVFYLGLTLLFVWEYVLQKVAPSASSLVGSGVARIIPGSEAGSSSAHIDWATLGGVSIVFAVVYYLAAWVLDHNGRRGAGVAFALVGFLALAGGIAALAPNLKQVGTGILLIIAGLLVGGYGSRYGRRFTTWVWAIAAGFGAVLILSKIVTHGGVAIGVGLIILGLIFVIGGWLVARAIREPDDVPDTATAAAPL